MNQKQESIKLHSCEEAAEKMKLSETTVADIVMRDKSRQYEGTGTKGYFSQLLQAHTQLRKKRRYRKARNMVKALEESTYKKLSAYPPSSSIEMETLMKRPNKDLEDADKATIKEQSKPLTVFPTHLGIRCDRSKVESYQQDINAYWHRGS